MQNFNAKQKGFWHHWTTSSTGAVISDTLTPTAGENSILTQVGYVGPKPSGSPMTKHAYSLNVQQIDLYHRAQYDYLNGNHEFADGQGLDLLGHGATLGPAYNWTSLENRALSRLNNGDLRGPGVRGNLDVSVDLAESHKTLKMLHIKDQLTDFTKAFVGRFGPLKAAGNLWLLYQYGIRPTLSTLFGTADEAIRIVINKTASLNARESEAYYPTTCQVGTVVGNVTFNVPKGTHIKVSVTYGVDIRTDQFDLSRWSSLNPLSIAWELLPFSFVADWFINVGGYLRNLETYLLYANKFNSGYKTRLVVGTVPFEIIDVGVATGEKGHSSIWTGHLRLIDIHREILTSYPAPHLPSLRAELGSSQLLSGAALLSQLLNGGSGGSQRASRGALRAVQEAVSLFQDGKPAKVFHFPPTHHHL